MLADSGQHNPQEPAFATGGAGLNEQEVILFALVRTLDAAVVVFIGQIVSAQRLLGLSESSYE